MTNRYESVTLTARTVIHCDRCGTWTRAGKSEGWNTVWRKGYIKGFLCPKCQTPEENAEAEINEATFEIVGTDAFGRAIGRIKGDVQ